MKDFVKIQYSTLWNLSFDQSYFSANGNQFFLHFPKTPASFPPSSGKVFVKEILVSAYWKEILELIVVSTSRKKSCTQKNTVFDRNSDSRSQIEGFVKKIRFQ